LLDEKGIIEQHEALLQRKAQAEKITEQTKDAVGQAREVFREVELAGKAVIEKEQEEFKAQKHAFIKDLERKIWQMITLFIQTIKMKL
jgi:hypothetical protein